MSRIPDYGAIGYHWSCWRWFADLYIWRRGPWRLSWSCRFRGHSYLGHLETPVLNNVVSRIVVDVLWGLRHRRRGKWIATYRILVMSMSRVCFSR
jgi:hypothetical protein